MAGKDAVFLEGNLFRHIFVMSGTAAIGMVAIFLVDLIDLFFISLLGNQALAAAVGFAGTILFFTTSLSIGMSITAGALVARDLGEGDPDRAREQATHVLVVGVALAMGVALLVWFNLHNLTALIGATGDVQALAVRYLQIVIPSMPLMLIAMVGSAVIRSHGLARVATQVTLAGAAANAALDPLFIFGFGLGLDGAAYATLAARVAMAVAALWPIFKRLGGLAGLSLSALIPDLRPIVALAVPTILANLATPVGGAYVTRAMAEFGEDAIAGMAIIGRVTPVAFAIIFALSGAIGPIIGQNFGAKKHDRVALAYREAMRFTAVYVVGAVIILFLLRGVIANIFGADDGIARDLIFLFCGPLSLAWFFNGILFVGNAAFNNLGHPFYSTWINWGRNTLGIVPFVWLGAQLYGAEGVLIGQMAGGVFVALISMGLARYTMRQAQLASPPNLKGPVWGADARPHKAINQRL